MESRGPDQLATDKAVRRAPLAGVALAMAAGIVAGRFLPLPTLFWAVLAVTALAVAAAALRRRRFDLVTVAAVAVVITSLAAAHLRLSYFAIDADHIVTYAGEGSSLATLRGQIVTSPMRLTDSTTMGYRRPDRTAFVLRCDQVRTESGWQDVSGLVRVSIREPADALAAGQNIELLGSIGRFRRPGNPGQFDQAAAARRNSTLVWMAVPGADGVAILAGEHMAFYERLWWNLRATSRQHLFTFGSPHEGRLMNALLIGERHPALGDLNRAMIRSGTAHFLSISGLHLGVFLGFVYLLCRLCMLNPRRSAWVVLIVLGAYVLLASPRAPLLRSAMMATCLCLAAIFRRRYSALNALSAAWIVLLIIDPAQLFSPGFQLSFVIVVAIIVGIKPTQELLFGRWIRRRGLVVFRTDQTLRRRLHHLVPRRAMDIITLVLVAYFAAAPLVAYHFGLFSPYAVVLNVLLFPLVAAVLIPGYVSMALMWPLPGLAHSIGRVASAAADLLSRAVEALNMLPGLSVELYAMPIAWLMLCYAALLLIVCARKIPLGRLWAGLALAALVLWTAVAQRPAPPPPAAELHLLSVGSGQCAILRTPTGATFLLDAGSNMRADAYTQVIEPFVRKLRLPKPRQAFLSHANTDHFNALSAPMRAGQIERVYLNDYFGLDLAGPSASESATAEFMELLAASDADVLRLRAGSTVQLDERTKIEVLWPPARRRNDLSVNDTSLILRITCDGRSVLLTGDLDQTGQEELAAAPGRIHSDVLVLPHHGGWETSLPAFFDAVNPSVVLVSCGRDPAAGGSKPRQHFYSRIRHSKRYYATSRNGWIRLRFGHSGLRVETMR